MAVVVTGDETGLLKRIMLAGEKAVAVQTVPGMTQARSHGVVSVAHTTPPTVPRFTALFRDGTVSSYKAVPLAMDRELDPIELDDGDVPVGLAALSRHHHLACTRNGAVRVWKASPPPSSAGSNDGSDDDEEKGEEEETKFETGSFTVGSPVEAMHVSASRTELAVGGRENDVRVWDINRQTTTFEARNVKHDWLDMRIPVWVKGLRFLQSTSVGEGDRAHVIATCTGHKHIRLYDTRAGRRPVKTTELGEYPFTAITHAPGGSGDYGTVVFGDTTGAILRMDLGSMLLTGSYPGAGGSIRGLAVHPTMPLLASVGLDRCLRVHHLEKRSLKHRVYLKQRLTTVMFVEGLGSFGPQDEDSDSDDSVLGGLETVTGDVIDSDEEDSDDDDDDAEEEEESSEGDELFPSTGAGAGAEEDDSDDEEEEEDDDDEDDEDDEEDSDEDDEDEDSSEEDDEPSPSPVKRRRRR